MTERGREREREGDMLNYGRGWAHENREWQITADDTLLKKCNGPED